MVGAFKDGDAPTAIDSVGGRKKGRASVALVDRSMAHNLGRTPLVRPYDRDTCERGAGVTHAHGNVDGTARKAKTCSATASIWEAPS